VLRIRACSRTGEGRLGLEWLKRIACLEMAALGTPACNCIRQNDELDRNYSLALRSACSMMLVRRSRRYRHEAAHRQ
jgi:hypothetical protein